MKRNPPADVPWSRQCFSVLAGLAVVLILVLTTPGSGKIVELKNGMEVRGLIAKVSSLGTDLHAGGGGAVNNQLIVVVDDGLRRVFFFTHQVANITDEIETLESIRLRQPVQHRAR